VNIDFEGLLDEASGPDYVGFLKDLEFIPNNNLG
jgi:hypothetical protein